MKHVSSSEPFEKICGHKFHAPKGVGALYIKSPLLPDPIFFGGGHENERRAGTENMAGIAGLVNAIDRFTTTPVFERPTLQPLTERLAMLTDIDEVNLAICAARGNRKDNTPSVRSPKKGQS